MSDQNPRSQAQQHNIDVRFSDVWQAIDGVREKKQNKFNAMVWVPLLIYIASLTIGGIYGAAELSSSVGSMKQQLSTAVEDRYRGGDAERDFALRDERIKNNTESIAEQKEQLSRIEDGVGEIQRRLPQ